MCEPCLAPSFCSTNLPHSDGAHTFCDRLLFKRTLLVLSPIENPKIGRSMTIALKPIPAERVSTERWSELMALKYGPPEKRGWGPRLRDRFHYRTPDDWYEATVFDLVTSETVWLDVGCGRDLFPSNPAAAHVLASRCRLLVGLDPSDNIDENPFVHERAKCQLEDFETDRKFDLITLRMVAEHIRDPQKVARVLSRAHKARRPRRDLHRFEMVSCVFGCGGNADGSPPFSEKVCYGAHTRRTRFRLYSK